jgi:hypothetical protein
MLFREIIDFDSEYYTRYINSRSVQNSELRNIGTGGTHSNHCSFKELVISWHMGHFYNNRGISVSILTATNRRTAPSSLRRWQLCFLCILCLANAWNNRTSTARQRSCKHASLTKDGVFRKVRAEELSWRQSALRVESLLGRRQPRKFVVEELEVGLWRQRMNWKVHICCSAVISGVWQLQFLC